MDWAEWHQAVASTLGRPAAPHFGRCSLGLTERRIGHSAGWLELVPGVIQPLENGRESGDRVVEHVPPHAAEEQQSLRARGFAVRESPALAATVRAFELGYVWAA